MSNLVTAITCTGGRPEAFALCIKYMERQTRKPDQWIIVNDVANKGSPPITSGAIPGTSIELVFGPREWEPGLNTQRFNMEESLKHVAGDLILIWEDEEQYAPNYVEQMVSYLKSVDLVGLARARYYHVGLPGFKEMFNHSHASLSQTAMRKSVLPLLKAAIDSGEMYFDINLWNAAQAQKVPLLLASHTNLSVGIKGMPGREGLTASHRELRDYQIDSGQKQLIEWIGQDAQLYKPFKNKVIKNEKVSKIQIPVSQKSI